ncbi:uncharacterized protein BO80DRAFT_355742 [Aspergillus ibericus CBS 121593]|uniref:Terpenoid synthase n=1 Tax=Aspergillus ibericus CBS 121593 TaxID=1448316 RepID=A0A395GZ95_9EURO|nr:hypothetical protein BO80DRAFT_355742 [Aspergillus ibericus CBS 121593]RAL00932.1 hypothetical protein BO80DRAFT_355742 [Aspergillus ibericus CBS 121593]
MEFMWNECKNYFNDGVIPGSAPFRSNVHICDLTPPPTNNHNHNHDYGIEISQQLMPLFSTLGGISPPPCTCHDITAIRQHIDNYIHTAPSTHPNDYTIFTEKNDTSIDIICLYTLRDVLQWWTFWAGSLNSTQDRWKLLYIAFGTIADDVMIPPIDVLNGTFRFLGHTLADVLAGLQSEHVNPHDLKFLEMCLWRQYIVQYLEKCDPSLRTMLLGKTTLMTQFRIATANAAGTAVAVLAAMGTQSRGVLDAVVEMMGTGCCLSMDMAKEALGVLNGEGTETVAGERERLKRELRWVYVRCIERLNGVACAPVAKRYATSGLVYVFLMERYRERVSGVRVPISGALRAVLDGLVGG